MKLTPLVFQGVPFNSDGVSLEIGQRLRVMEASNPAAGVLWQSGAAGLTKTATPLIWASALIHMWSVQSDPSHCERGSSDVQTGFHLMQWCPGAPDFALSETMPWSWKPSLRRKCASDVWRWGSGLFRGSDLLYAARRQRHPLFQLGL